MQHKELISFNEAELDKHSPESILNAVDLRIHPNDLLRITVHSLDPEAAAPFNIDPVMGQGQGGGNINQMFGGGQGNQGAPNNLELFNGYFVDEQGFIDFPVLGRIKVGSLTIPEAKVKIATLLEAYLRDAVVNMRFLNFKITVLGEVNRPGTLRLTNERITLLEALGMAGDLTFYANRTNLLVIREQEGVRKYARINLQTDTIFQSEYFYLQQNDVVYVEPLQARVATVSDPANRLISYISAFLSIVTLGIALFAN